MNAQDVREVRAALVADHRLRGRRFCDAYTNAIDDWLTDELARAIRRTNRRMPSGIALLAVGSYGRRELCPGSDLDLVLVHDGVRGIGTVADALWYPVWDASLQLDHSVRTPRETLTVARDDLKAALGLLSARLVSGDEKLATNLLAELKRRWNGDPRTSLLRLRASLDERWSQHGELAFVAEPDIKLSRGGLRDVEALQAAALAMPVLEQSVDDPRLEAAADTLLGVRVALHVVTGRRSDRLLVEDQDAVARKLGNADANELFPDVVSAARRITWATDQAWQQIGSRLAKPRRAMKDQQVEPGISVRNEELIVDGTVDPGTESALPLRIAAASARTGIRIADATLARLETDAAPPTEPWPRETLDALLDLLGYGQAAVGLLETLDQLGVLGRYVPEWAAVRGRPQRNAYYRYTVDRHLLETAAAAAELTRTVGRPDLLLLAAWLHDIGKGFPGDHAEGGERLAAAIATRMGFEPGDVGTIALLVRHHRLLRETATRRDLDDPATVAMVAHRVRNREELDLLAALTHAAAAASGPATWNSLNASLVDDLVERTRTHLAGERPERPTGPTPEQRALMAAGELRLVPNGARVTVIAPDRAGLLGVVAGVLSLHRLSVRSATGTSENGMAAEVYDLDPNDHDEPDWSRIESDLAAALEDPTPLQARLAQRSRSGKWPLRSGAARPAAPRVLVDKDATPRATIIEVRAADALGVLSRIARVLASCHCDITFVRALTLGHEVVDTFYVTDEDTGMKVTDDARLFEIERKILEELEHQPDAAIAASDSNAV